jgi:hypothetical protein
MWPADQAEDVVEALAAADQVVLGLDVRDYAPDGTYVETAWLSFEPDGHEDVARSCRAALNALRDRPLPGDWVLVHWRWAT